MNPASKSPQITQFDVQGFNQPEFISWPHDTLRSLRETSPILQAFNGRKSFILSHPEATQALKHPAFSSSLPLVNRERLGTQYTEEEKDAIVSLNRMSRSLITMDPPQHTVQRQQIVQAFNTIALDHIYTRVSLWTANILHLAMRNGTLDVVNDLAQHVPIQVMGHILGIPKTHLEQLQQHALSVTGTLTSRSGSIVVDAAHNMTAFRAFIAKQVQYRKVAPQDDFISALISQSNGTMPDEDIVAISTFLFFAGFETTKNLIANGLHLFVLHPEQYEILRSKPELASQAIEEIARFDPGVQGVNRSVKEDTIWHGYTFPKGSSVFIWFTAANHDPQKYTAPDTFDINRVDKTHLGFGYGHHYCVGAQLARLETRAIFATLAEHVKELTLPSLAVRNNNFMQRGFTSFQLQLR